MEEKDIKLKHMKIKGQERNGRKEASGEKVGNQGGRRNKRGGGKEREGREEGGRDTVIKRGRSCC